MRDLAEVVPALFRAAGSLDEPEVVAGSGLDFTRFAALAGCDAPSFAWADAETLCALGFATGCAATLAKFRFCV